MEKVTTKEGKKILKTLIGEKGKKQHITPFIFGPPGLGKSCIVKEIQKEEGYKYLVDVRLSQHDETDFKFPDKHDGFVHWITADFMPVEGNKKYDGPGILFFDETNRGSQAVLQAIFQPVLDRYIGSQKIRDDWKIICAGNLGYEDNTFVNEMDAALKNRFAIIKIERVNADEWVEWAKKNNINQLIINFIEQNPDQLYVQGKDNEFIVTPRSWHFLSNILNDSNDIVAMATQIAQTIIHGVTGRFLSYLQEKVTVKPEDVMCQYSKVKKILNKLERADIHCLNIELCTYINNNIKNFKKINYQNFIKYFDNHLLDDNKVYILKKINEDKIGNKFLINLVNDIPNLKTKNSAFFKLIAQII